MTECGVVDAMNGIIASILRLYKLIQVPIDALSTNKNSPNIILRILFAERGVNELNSLLRASEC